MESPPVATAGSGTLTSIRPGSASAWVLAARPKTLAAAVAPVAVGTACAYADGVLRVAPAVAALLGALLLQVGANFANDVFDYEKGADTAERLGPTRAVQAGLLTPGAVRRGLFVVFAIALGVGIYLTLQGGWVILAIGILSMLSAVAYTGGPYPLGYHGLGDIFVFVFFGLIAVPGSVYVHAKTLPELSFWAAVPVGALATAILVVNNLRDRDTDARAGKRTLAVRFGRSGALFEYYALLALSYLVPVALVVLGKTTTPWVLLPLSTVPLAVALGRGVAREHGSALNERLAGTARLSFLYGLLLAVGIVLDARWVLS
jgi:1,4-dihydroxy-2-naphthoate polyprenyltransferase